MNEGKAPYIVSKRVACPCYGSTWAFTEGEECSDCHGTGSYIETRNYLAEALKIASGQSKMSIQREHLTAIVEHGREFVGVALGTMPLIIAERNQVLVCERCEGKGEIQKPAKRLGGEEERESCPVCLAQGVLEYRDFTGLLDRIEILRAMRVVRMERKPARGAEPVFTSERGGAA